MPVPSRHSGAAIIRSTRSLRPAIDALERRELLSSLPSAPTADEQYMLQLINRARANPPAEAQRLLAEAQTDPVLKNAVQGLDLSAFVREMSLAVASPPLAFNTRLIAASRDRNLAMLAANDQKHAPGGFLVDPKFGLVAGDNQVYYAVGQSSWSTGENLFAYSQNVNSSSIKDYVDYFEAGFLIDWGNPDFGHLKNILAPGPSQAAAQGEQPYSEIGIALLANAYPKTPAPANPDNAANKGFNVGPVLVTQEFAWKTGNAFLTGAVYRDSDHDDFYTPGEGFGGITIQATGLHGEGTFSATTWDSGGYSLSLPPGTYSVTASGGTASTRTVVIAIGQDNVGWDIQYEPGTVADQPVLADYDGDGRTDIAVYRPSTGEWFIQGSRVGTYSVAFGQPNIDVPVPADYDGDGRADLAVYRPTTGYWLILGSSSPGRIITFGAPGLDNPVPADYDGDGRADLALYRPSMGLWYIIGTNSPGRIIPLGKPGVDVPVPNDYDGDGRADLAVYRPTEGLWYILGTNSPGRIIPLGMPNVDVPIPSDFDGDGRADLAVYRPTAGYWLILGTNSPGRILSYGVPTLDIPVPADYDGDGRADLAAYRPSTAQWFQIKTRDGTANGQFGQGGGGRISVALASQSVANYGVQSTRIAAPSPASAFETGKTVKIPARLRRKRANQSIKVSPVA